jgi:Redoxin
MPSEPHMKALTNDHPSLAELSDLLAWGRGRTTPAEMLALPHAIHARSCITCQESMAFLESLRARASTLPSPAATVGLRERIMQSRAVPLRPIAISEAVTVRRTTRRWLPATAIAAALALVFSGMFVSRDHELQAGATAGVMELSTSTPRPGERVRITYRPGVSLSRFSELRVRARVRTQWAESSAAGVPIVTLATLTKQRDGSFTANCDLPDSIVYAALAVEDTAATEIDDRDSRTWELLRATDSGRVTFDALQQRMNDLMGRNWDEVFATVQRMVDEYPDSIRSWSNLRAANSWRGMAADSNRAPHLASLAKFEHRTRAERVPSGDQLGWMYWYARGVDTNAAVYWRERLQREAPLASFAVMNRMSDALRSLWVSKDSATALRTLEALWADAPRDRRESIANYACEIALAGEDTAAMRRWSDRLMSMPTATPGLARLVAMRFVSIPALRAEGMQRLRQQLAALEAQPVSERALDETRAAQRARIGRSTRTTYSALGRSLLMNGQTRAALDTLALASAEGWEPEIFRAVRSASLAANDTGTALLMTARLVVDPRTTARALDSLQQFGQRIRGATVWLAMLTAQRAEFVKRTLASARARIMVDDVRLGAIDGNAAELRAITRGKVTVVAFLSRFCGYAIEAIPALNVTADRLAQRGVQTVVVVDERTRSAGLDSFLASHKVASPVYLDTAKDASTAFNQWGTPNYFVVDGAGRIMFGATSSLDDALVRADAVRLAAESL